VARFVLTTALPHWRRRSRVTTLNPFQPNHRMPAPTAAITRLLARRAVDPVGVWARDTRPPRSRTHRPTCG